ncbi:MAG: hypothetical protein J1E64_05045 [Acetatifactor sp.]|nr:hypothetical protein [Acetatifactor sp.]
MKKTRGRTYVQEEQKRHTENEIREINDFKLNIYQILLKYEMIYILKFFVFVIIAATVFIKEPFEFITRKDFIGYITFMYSISIDCVVLAKNLASKVKGIINFIHLCFTLFTLVCAVLITLLFLGVFEISTPMVIWCNLTSWFCCVSPILELVYDTIVRIENEKEKEYYKEK